MALRTPPSWLQNGSHPAENDRLSMQAIIATGGIIGTSSLSVTQAATPGMAVQSAAGWGAIVGNYTTNMGVYQFYNDAATQLTVTTADPTNPRIDRVVVTINDSYYTGATNNVVFAVVAGTPAASPVAPSTPTNSISLATIAVAAAATSIVNANITDTRANVTTNLPVGDLTEVTGGTGITVTSGTGPIPSVALTTPVAVLNGGTGVTTSTGSGANVLGTSPTLTTPSIGVATGTSFNSITGLSSTNPAALGSVAVGTGTTTARADHVHPTTGLGLTASGLNQFAATTSAQLAGVISDETGSGLLVFGTSPTITTPTLSGNTTAGTINSTTIPSTKTLVVTTDTLAVFAATTSAQLAGVISDETGSGSLVFATSPTLTSAVENNPLLKSPEERCTISATAATGTVAFDTQTQGVLYYTTNATANFTLNFTNVNANLTTGDSISCVFLNTNGATAYYPTAFQVDSVAVTPKWSGGTAPSAGNASAIDSYSFIIIKTGAATFTVLAGGAVKFA